ncbi:MAG TPA: M17 family peptidase N-terminal domain-containing protein [Candidatus Limnocylindria bacterium]
MVERSSRRVTRAGSSFELLPSRHSSMDVTVDVARSVPEGATAIGVPVAADGGVPRERVDLDRATLEASGFGATVGQTLVLPRADGPTIIEIGVGSRAELGAAAIRDAAAAFARAAVRHADLAIDLTGVVSEVEARVAGQAVVEGVLMARYRYRAFIDRPSERHLARLTLVAPANRARSVAAGAQRGAITAGAVNTARDLCNAPATHLTARRYAEVAERLGSDAGLDVQVFDEKQLAKLGCGGLLGVNAGSGEPARMIKLTYAPPGRSRGNLHLVGKGIMYDAGGISLKPSDAMHAAMKLDMSGSAAILGAMTTLRDLGCRTTVTGWLMCTDNMPSGTATRLGDVLTTHSGKTIEVINADAEGRLVMADGIDMAVEEGADAIVTVATLTGAALRTFGTAGAAMMANRRDLAEQLDAAGAATDELVWELPFIRRYRSQIDSAIADVKNMGGENAGTITAGLFLEAFTEGIPYGYLDICGPMMTNADDSWRSVGATAFGTRLLAEFASNFKRPGAA